jgi:hypothetical protein
LKYNDVLEQLLLSSNEALIDVFNTVSFQSLFDYNATIFFISDLEKCDEECFESIHGLLEKNKCGQRTAIKKGVPRRQDSYVVIQ